MIDADAETYIPLTARSREKFAEWVCEQNIAHGRTCRDLVIEHEEDEQWLQGFSRIAVKSKRKLSMTHFYKNLSVDMTVPGEGEYFINGNFDQYGATVLCRTNNFKQNCAALFNHVMDHMKKDTSVKTEKPRKPVKREKRQHMALAVGDDLSVDANDEVSSDGYENLGESLKHMLCDIEAQPSAVKEEPKRRRTAKGNDNVQLIFKPLVPASKQKAQHEAN